MNSEQAKQALGLDATASSEEALAELNKKRIQVVEKLAAAPTEALKAKFEQSLTQLAEAEKALNPSPARSSLSETKLADLPGAAPVGDGSAQLLHLKPGDKLGGRYEIKELIGQGGMGAVYRTFDKNRQQDIAIKVLLPSLTSHEKARERFLNEARLSSDLSHPNIVNVYDVQQEGDIYFLTMELLEGQDLRQVMENRKMVRQNFSEQEMVELARALGAGLDHAHKKTIHRDIKPENVWQTEEGEYKLMDFGIARLMSTSQRTQTGAAMGTAYYMAPEQLKGARDIDGRADQYAIGVLLYEMATGEVPAGIIKPLELARKDLGKGFCDAVTKCLQADPSERHLSMSAFISAIETKNTFPVGSPGNKKSVQITLMVMALLAVGVVLGVAVLNYQGKMKWFSADNTENHKSAVAVEYVKLDEVVVELKNIKFRRYAKVSVSLQVKKPGDVPIVRQNSAALRDIVIDKTSSMTLSNDVASAADMQFLSREILSAIQSKLMDVADRKIVARVLFTGFVIQ